MNNLNLAKKLIDNLELLEAQQQKLEVGTVISSADGICFLEGLSGVKNGEMLQFENRAIGFVVNLEPNRVGAVVLSNTQGVSSGTQVRSLKKFLSLGVSDQILGRVINPLGEPLDGKQPFMIDKYMPLESIAPGVVERDPVDTPLQTGIKAIDSMIPIGRGQRELIIGDRGVGKTAIALDTIINQKRQESPKKVKCIYVSIGQKASKVASIIDILVQNKAMENTIIVAANASDSAALNFIAPYAGCAIGEYFMRQGDDVLIVYDDLSKHAWNYRQISLILKRPSGREAYPGDIFYLHSRLLERACRLSKKNGGGSLTALPIVETQAGDVSAYIPTNIISITDGQIYLEPDLFLSGVKPAINIGLSVSRVGSAAQIRAMKQVTGKLRLDLAQYKELAAFSQFASELDESTRSQIERGTRMMEVLKQPVLEPVPLFVQVAVFFGATRGYFDNIAIEKMSKFTAQFQKHLQTTNKNLLEEIMKLKTLTAEIEEKLDKVILKFKSDFLTLN